MSELAEFVLGKLWVAIKNYPLIFGAVLLIIIVLSIIVAKHTGDMMETKYQHWVLWVGIGFVIIVIVFFALRLIEAGKFFF